MICLHEPGRGVPEPDFLDRIPYMAAGNTNFCNSVNSFASAPVLGR